MKKVCLTYFEAFGNRSENISMKVASDVEAKGITLDKVEFKVSYDEISQEVSSVVNRGYDLIILTGEAGGRSKVTLEKVALNLKSAIISDNYGKYYFNERIDDGDAAYFSNLDVLDLAKRLKEEGYNIDASLSAGSYLCNMSYFYALKEVYKKKLETKVVFVHFPINENIKEDKEIIERLIEIV